MLKALLSQQLSLGGMRGEEEEWQKTNRRKKDGRKRKTKKTF